MIGCTLGVFVFVLGTFLYLFWVLLSSIRKALESGLDAILILATIRLVRPPYCVGEVDNLMKILIFAKDVRGSGLLLVKSDWDPV